ncbi:TetR/AcrR family transcriptional regulator [Hyphomonas jannaschiana]|uniref:TetR family transcriptional regulator n=1 Tax=Hyphomonas jannaschiana VP2 TaxID=1280952 RepID=A0A059FKY4_9PROT|nr:TetR/AcrR family transcriptional regulator [Hyphomonas jannaschiana]KCZ91191.1 TetR family transcriptional regulator [Hyphomonas jannaschiana VP2]
MSDTKTASTTDSAEFANAGRMTQAERRERSEQELLEATMRVVSASGVAAATFDAIGKEAGYSRGLVTQRFGSKDGLIRSLISALHGWQREALEAAHVERMDGLSALCAFVELHCRSLDGREEDKAYYMLLAAAVADRLETRAAFAESHELERVLIRKIIERGQAEGSIRKDADADATALMAGCALIGIRMQNMIDPGTEIAPIRDALVQSLRARLAPV